MQGCSFRLTGQMRVRSTFCLTAQKIVTAAPFLRLLWKEEKAEKELHKMPARACIDGGVFACQQLDQLPDFLGGTGTARGGVDVDSGGIGMGIRP